MHDVKVARPGNQLLTSVKAHDSLRVHRQRATSQACILGQEGGLTVITSCADSVSEREARQLNQRSSQGRSEPAGDTG